VSLIIRGLAFEYRGKNDSISWRRNWDIAIFVCSLLPAILWGVAFANIVHGVKIDDHHEYAGGFFDLLSPYALTGGITSLLLFLVHGNVFLSLKNTGDLRERAHRLELRLSIPMSVVMAAFVLWTYFDVKSNLAVLVVAVGAIVMSLVTVAMLQREREGWGFIGTGLVTVLFTATLFLSLYPNVMPSSIDDAFSLTIVNASSTPYTLKVMTVVAAFMVPVVLAYQTWTYWIFRKRLVRPV
jgi:cytochrome d ubiquinol oxidase subunit II